MNEQPKTDTELDALVRIEKLLASINSKLGFFVLILIVWIIISILF